MNGQLVTTLKDAFTDLCANALDLLSRPVFISSAASLLKHLPPEGDSTSSTGLGQISRTHTRDSAGQSHITVTSSVIQDYGTQVCHGSRIEISVSSCGDITSLTINSGLPSQVVYSNSELLSSKTLVGLVNRVLRAKPCDTLSCLGPNLRLAAFLERNTTQPSLA